MNIVEKHHKSFELAGILMSCFLAFQCFMLWNSPEVKDVNKIFTLSHLIIFEFFMVHSALIMTTFPKRITVILAIPFYGFYAWLLNEKVPNNIIFVTYLLMILNRIRFAFSDASPETRKNSQWFSGLALGAHFCLLFIAGFLSQYFAPMGLTSDFLLNSGYFSMGVNPGEFLGKPHLALAIGVVYYLILAFLEAMWLKGFGPFKSLNLEKRTVGF